MEKNKTGNISQEELAVFGGTPVVSYALPTIKDVSGRDVGAEELKLVTEVVMSGNFGYLYGTKLKQFQKEWADRFGTDNALGVSSGTAALHTAMIFLDIGPGDEVLVPAITDMGTVIAVLLQNAVPVFVDVDIKTQNIDPSDIEHKITKRTKAIIPVHLYGFPCDMDPIMETAQKHGLYVVEDCAQAHLTRYKGRLAGTIGHAGCFSFQQSKHMTTGDGGMIIVQQDELCGRKLVHCADKGWPREKYREHLFLAPNYHMTELQAAVGIAQLRKLDRFIENRRTTALHLTALLEDIPGAIPPKDTTWGYHTFYEYPLFIDPKQFKVNTDILSKALTAEGVSTSPGYLPKPIYMYDMIYLKKTYGNSGCPFSCSHYAKEQQYSDDMCPNAVYACGSMLYIPWNEKMTKVHSEDIAKAIRKVLVYYHI